MANTKEIKSHIGSVKSTQKITNAMYLIASTKMRRARQDVAQTKPYFDALSAEMERIFCRGTLKSRYLDSDRTGADAYLVITADRGLAGAYNQNVLKAALKEIGGRENCRLFVVGDYGRQFCSAHGVAIEKSFLYTAQNPTLSRARELRAQLLEMYDSGEIARLHVIYTDFGSGMNMQVKSHQLLPLIPEKFSDTGCADDFFNFEPSAEAVLESIVPSYVTGYLYAALVESFCCEQSARANAMDAANRNAEELLENLQREFNHERQSAITQEITEVSAGARANQRNLKEARR